MTQGQGLMADPKSLGDRRTGKFLGLRRGGGGLRKLTSKMGVIVGLIVV